MNQNDILQLSFFLISGFVVGLVIRKWIIPIFAKLASKTSIKSDDLIIATISSWVIAWFVALGLYLGISRISMDDRYNTLLENGLMIFYVLSGTLIAARIISGMLRIKTSGSETVIPSSSIISNIVKVIVYCVGLLVILQSQGISITPLLTALGVGGLAVALALQPTLSNLFAGLQIITSGKMNPGDYIKLDSGEEGFILDITWRNTTIRAVSDHIVIIPNSKMADMIVSNYHLPVMEITFNLVIGVSYDSDLEHVETVTKDEISKILNDMEAGVKDFEPFIRYFAFDDSSINLKAFMRVKTYSDQFLVRHEFIKRLHARYNKEGINIPFPIRTVMMQKDDE